MAPICPTLSGGIAMCAGSIAAGIKERAEIGDALILKTFQRGYFRSSPVNLKLFAPVNNPACPVCINFGSTVLFRNLPVNIQQRAGVYVETEAELVSQDVGFHAGEMTCSGFRTTRQ